MIPVVGTTGTNGREVVRRLVATGQRVRAMVRTPSRAGDLPSENSPMTTPPPSPEEFGTSSSPTSGTMDLMFSTF